MPQWKNGAPWIFPNNTKSAWRYSETGGYWRRRLIFGGWRVSAVALLPILQWLRLPDQTFSGNARDEFFLHDRPPLQ